MQMPTSNFDGLVKSHHNRWLCKKPKFKARALTTTRRAGGLDFSASGRKDKSTSVLATLRLRKQTIPWSEAYFQYAAATVRRRRKAQSAAGGKLGFLRSHPHWIRTCGSARSRRH